MRQSLGTAVFFGMLGVTCFGLLLTPNFYTVVRRVGNKHTMPAAADLKMPDLSIHSAETADRRSTVTPSS